ncbi:uncharacterized protein ACLA_065460 [Aspergillus clavatus NRRL 1]|uniref:DUF7357 domain-containing protein n=1 Tax=Aspergillus clavatus (strain ATCC 1007 / CBS 513.65 / DSM 816 / NCTC 3887 / NRRL 1 / QM 1276 / 107) TaxID=344612 RepID=A1CG32_ASPCL|nr:uncharacterized protein ACLA_065460 [Aspergillus clavatus NRRL 1]EAW10912.1 conserved hypothetical protein [Aspergillus clavatus NRRL 1]
MRLHLIIQRHGLPVTRILWTTSPPSIYNQAASSSSVVPVASSLVASTRTPNALFSSDGYTVAQLLEDVNEVVPLETEPAIFDSESSGQWGLEDYVVEVGGSECLHFMEVEGLLRDGDEVIIRALQVADLRARRLSGRHQISIDGKHLIDGVPFGRPFLKRQSSSRPAISIPPRKKRRTILATWDSDTGFSDEEAQWNFPGRMSSMRELSRLKDQEDDDMVDEFTDYHQDDDYEDYHDSHEDSGDGTVIRHSISEDEEDDDVESDIEAEDLAEELEALEKDQESADFTPIPKPDQEQAGPGGYPLRTRTSILRTASRNRQSHAFPKSPSEAGSSRRDSKVVRFKKAEQPTSPCPSQPEGDSHVSKTEQTSEDSISIYKSFSSSPGSDSSDTTSDDEDSASPSEDSSSDSDSSSGESEAELEDDSEDDDSTSDSDDSTTSESEGESVSSAASEVKLQPRLNPPGQGSLRTKKSNQRNKLRRRLSKLKELGALPAEADFAALRDWEIANGGWYEPSENKQGEKRRTKDPEQEEFEAKRQKLLRDLASGGVDIDLFTEKENVLRQPKTTSEVLEEDSEDDAPAVESTKRRTLDVASSRRMLFGSLGVRAPRSKEDEEATRKKLAGKSNIFQSRRQEEQATVEEADGDSEENWEDKLVLKATECIFDDIELSAPPFPFEQRWDAEAHQIIGKRKGWGRKRKRRQQLQVYDAEGYEDYGNGNDGYAYEDLEVDHQLGQELNYDDPVQTSNEVTNDIEPTVEASENPQDDLPLLPADLSTVPDLTVDDLKQGSVIAFKQLVLSKATNWQPTVSDYLMARIDNVFEDNVLKLQLAKRDRRQAAQADDEEGEDEESGRKYDGFEMPGMDEDQAEDDGLREISFVDLFDAKLIQAANVADVGGAAKVSNSSAAEKSSLQSPQSIAPEDEPMRDVKTIEEENPRQSPTKSVHSQDGGSDTQALADELIEEVEVAAEKSRAASPADRASPIVESPQFVGFHSPRAATPLLPEEPSKQEVSGVKPTAGPKAAEDNDGGEVLNPPQETAEAPSTPRSTASPNAFSETPRLLGSDDELQMLSSPENLINFNRLLEQLFQGKRPTPGSPIPKKEPRQSPKMLDTQISSSASSYVPNPFYDVDRAHEELLRGGTEQAKKDSAEQEGQPAAEAELPAPSPSSHSSPTSAQPQRSLTPQDHSLISAVEESNWLSRHDDAFSTQPPRASQFSNIVDLTQSSPPVSPGGSDDEDFAVSQCLPRGPGWVQKHAPSTRQRTRPSTAKARLRTLNERSISPPIRRDKRG